MVFCNSLCTYCRVIVFRYSAILNNHKNQAQLTADKSTHVENKLTNRLTGQVHPTWRLWQETLFQNNLRYYNPDSTDHFPEKTFYRVCTTDQSSLSRLIVTIFRLSLVIALTWYIILLKSSIPCRLVLPTVQSRCNLRCARVLLVNQTRALITAILKCINNVNDLIMTDNYTVNGYLKLLTNNWILHKLGRLTSYMDISQLVHSSSYYIVILIQH